MREVLRQLRSLKIFVAAARAGHPSWCRVLAATTGACRLLTTTVAACSDSCHIECAFYVQARQSSNLYGFLLVPARPVQATAAAAAAADATPTATGQDLQGARSGWPVSTSTLKRAREDVARHGDILRSMDIVVDDKTPQVPYLDPKAFLQAAVRCSKRVADLVSCTSLQNG